MKLKLSYLFAAALSAVPLAAQAQVGVYALFTENRMYGTDSSPLIIPGQVANSSVNPSGFTGGVYYDVRTYGPVRLGVDVRGTLTHTTRGAYKNSVGAGARDNSILGGVRGSFRTRFKIVQPYVQASAGLGRSDFGLGTTTGNGNQSPPTPDTIYTGFEYHAYAGADLKILPLLDFRAAEVGYGGISSGGHNYPILSVSTGVVFHFPTLQ